MNKIYPFKFLEAYQRKDKEIFFGRDTETDALYKMLFQSKVVLVYGASGTGKTSLIQCGLASKFQTYDWLALNVRRGRNLVAALDKMLCEESEETFTYTENSNFQITDLLPKIQAVYLASFRPMYFIFDQFEELYILGEEKEQKAFVEIVKQLLQVEQPLKIIFSIREEYLGYLYEFEKEVPELLRKKLRVEPANLDKVSDILRSISTLPQANVSLQTGEETALTQAIFEKIRGESHALSIQLPYLQVFLDRLYLQISQDQSRKQAAVFSLADLAKMGEIGDVLRDFLDEQVNKIAQKFTLSPEQVWEILSPFATLEGTKEAQKLSELQKESTQDLTPIFQTLETSRILRFNESEQVYEITHDSLAKQIHAKRSDEEIAIMEVQRLIKSQVLLKTEVRDYFSEKQLLFIEPFLDKFRLADEEQEWIDKSKAHLQAQKTQEEARKQAELAQAQATDEKEATLRAKAEQASKRAKTRSWIAIVVAVVAVIASVFAYSQYRQAEKQTGIAKSETEKAIAAEKTAKDAQKSDSLAKIKADSAAKVAEKNATEAGLQKQAAEKNATEAEQQKQNAEISATEAQTQKTKAEKALKENIQKQKEYIAKELLLHGNTYKDLGKLEKAKATYRAALDSLKGYEHTEIYQQIQAKCR
ncbi:MAG: hypothetical protein ACKVTZ_15770 [Bacteroidia bacterium]